ncbi:MAG: ATP synthase F1 subunit delta [Planctomycetota bacterium]
MPSTANTTDAVGRVYAQALVELAETEGQLDAVAEEVADLAALLESDTDLQRLIDNPIIDRGARAGMVERLFEGKVSGLLYKFLRVVNQKDRLAALPGICAAFNTMMAKRRNQLDVDAYVAQPMDGATASRVADGLGSSLGKQVNLVQHVDESLIGGLKLRIGDRMIDASVQSQLQRLEQQLIAAGREKARATASSTND